VLTPLHGKKVDFEPRTQLEQVSRGRRTYSQYASLQGLEGRQEVPRSGRRVRQGGKNVESREFMLM
jgi:hypothetical protein